MILFYYYFLEDKGNCKFLIMEILKMKYEIRINKLTCLRELLNVWGK